MYLLKVKAWVKDYREKDNNDKESLLLYNELIVLNLWGTQQADKGPFTPVPRTVWPKDI